MIENYEVTDHYNLVQAMQAREEFDHLCRSVGIVLNPEQLTRAMTTADKDIIYRLDGANVSTRTRNKLNSYISEFNTHASSLSRLTPKN